MRTMGCRLLLIVLLPLACSSSAGPPSSARAPTVDSGAPGPSPSDAGATGDTWKSYAQAFFATYCTSCHDASDTTGRDYTVQSKVLKDAASMRCGVAVSQDPSWQCASFPPPKQFPIGSGPKPTDAERDRIVRWITAGEP
jgi:hypothetical protein